MIYNATFLDGGTSSWTALFSFILFYSSLEKGQLYIFRVGSGQVSSLSTPSEFGSKYFIYLLPQSPIQIIRV